MGFRSFCWRDGNKGQIFWSSRVKIFCFAFGLRNIVFSKLHFKDFLVGLRIFVVGRWQMEHVLHAQLVVGVDCFVSRRTQLLIGQFFVEASCAFGVSCWAFALCWPSTGRENVALS